MGAQASTILRYNTLKEDEVNLCEPESPGSINNSNWNTLQNLGYFCSSFRVRIHPHVVIGCIVAVVLVIIITTTAIYKGSGANNGMLSNNTNETCTLDLSHSDYLSQPYNETDFKLNEETSVEVSDVMNASVQPCDNFYNFACQAWPGMHPRPENISSWTVFSDLSEKTDNLVSELMETPAEEEDISAYKLAQNFYTSCVQVEDEDSQRDEKVLNFVWDTLEKYGGWPILYKNGTWNSTRFNWKKSTTDLSRRFKTITILDIVTYQDTNGVLSNNTIYIAPPPSATLGRLEYKSLLYKDVDSFTTSESRRVDFIVNASKLLMKFKGQNDFDDDVLREQAKAIIDMYRDLNRHILTSTLFSKASGILILLGLQEKEDEKMTLEELQKKIDSFLNNDNKIQFRDILELLYNPAGVQISDKESLTVVDINYVLKVLQYIQDADAQTLANFLHYNMLVYMMPMLTRDFRELVEKRTLELYDTVQQVSRKQVCARDVEKSFRFAVGQKFVERQFESRCEFNDVVTQMQRMFHHIRDSLYVHRDSLSSFLDDSKLTKFINNTDICVGFPDWLYDSGKVQEQYVGLQLDNLTTYVEQSLATNAWILNSELVKLRVPVVVGECDWTWFPGEVGAFTYVEQFRLYFPLGILQRPFLRMGESLALNYGTMGTIIGHELTHAFTRFGWERTEDGSLTTGANCLVEQYDNFSLKEVFPKQNISEHDNVSLSGRKTLEENFADNGGIALAYAAFQVEESKGFGKDHEHEGHLSTVGQSQYSNEQLFFIGFAQNFCGSFTVNGMKSRMERDEHSPGFFRVLGTLRNCEEFARAWNCPSSSKMNNADDDRCSLLEIEDDDDGIDGAL